MKEQLPEVPQAPEAVLAQETFARVFAKRKDYQPSGKLSTWLWRIVLNLCYDELRR